MSTTNVYQHEIHLKSNSDQVYVKQYRLPFSQRAEIENQVKRMIKNVANGPALFYWFRKKPTAEIKN